LSTYYINLLSFPTRRSSDLKDPNSKIRCTPSAKRRVAVGRGWVSLKTSVFGTPDLQIPAGVDSTSYGNALRLKIWRSENRCFQRSEEHTSELQSLRHLVCRL